MRYPCSTCKTQCVLELLGTYLLVLIGPASIIATVFFNVGLLPSTLLVALAFGVTVGLAIVALGKYSGTKINPAITLAAAVARQLRLGFLLPYIGFQFMGGILAGLTLRLLFEPVDKTTVLGSTRIAAGVGPAVGMALEAIGTLALSSSALFAALYLKSPTRQALLVGTTLFVLILLVGPLTGAGFNPARSLGPAVASGYFADQYVYWVGPLSGAVIAGLVFRSIGRRRRGKRLETDTVCMC